MQGPGASAFFRDTDRGQVGRCLRLRILPRRCLSDLSTEILNLAYGAILYQVIFRVLNELN
jgi:hypothetical protein